MGFFALFNCVLNRLYYAERMGFIPFVMLPDNILYYDDNLKGNPFTYFFKQVSPYNYDEITNACNLVMSQEKDSQYILKGRTFYEVGESELDILAETWKKYIAFNKNTEDKLKADSEMFGNYKILGIHMRGTDFKKKNKNHPLAIQSNQYMDNLRKEFETGKYDKIFVATDEQASVNLLQNEFGSGNVLFYKDTLRASEKLNAPVHKSNNTRAYHNYKLGYEVIRDMYSLGNCTGLIAGRSQVSLAARMYNKAFATSKFEKIIVLDNGMCKI